MVMGKLRKRYPKLDVRVAMEQHSAQVLSRLQFTDYTLIDSGDMLNDLHALSDSDVLLLGGSSYGVLVHLLAPPGGLSIVGGPVGGGKYTDSGELHQILALRS